MAVTRILISRCESERGESKRRGREGKERRKKERKLHFCTEESV